MAKSKPLGKNEPKKFASYSSVHGNGKIRKPRKEKTKSGPKQPHKAAAHQKPKRKLEDPLAAAFTASIENSRAFLHQQAEAALKTIHQDLAQQVTALNDHFGQNVQTIAKSSEGARKPLDQDQLHFVSKNGEMAGTHSIDDRMQRFKEIITTEKKKIDDLERQWADINQSIAQFAHEVLGPEGVGDGLSPMSELLDYAVPAHKKFEEEVQSEKTRFSSKIMKANDTMILQTEACEKEINEMLRKHVTNLHSAIAAEI